MRPRSEPTPRRGDFRVWREIPTRWRDNDNYGHVNNAVYYDYFDTAINGFLMDAVGADIRDLTAIGVVAETGCRYLKELTFPDVLQIGIALEKVGRASVIYRLGISGASTRNRPRSAASCTCMWTGRPVRLPNSRR